MQVSILNDAEFEGVSYTVLLFNDIPPQRVYDMSCKTWIQLGLSREEVFTTDEPDMYCLGLPKDKLRWKAHRGHISKPNLRYISFNLNIIDLLNNLPEGWAHTIRALRTQDALQYQYLIDKSYLRFSDSQKIEEDQGYTQGYKDGCTGLKWL